METINQETHNTKKTNKKEISMRAVLNILGVFIFTGMALSTITNPLPTIDYTKEFLIFIGGSAIFYHLLVNIYFVSSKGRKFVYITVFLLACVSVFMTIYLVINSASH